MRIHYVKNAWGRLLPIYFDKCCDVMTMQFSPENDTIFCVAADEPKLIQLAPSRKKVVDGNVTKCPFCKVDIEFIERELKDEKN